MDSFNTILSIFTHKAETEQPTPVDEEATSGGNNYCVIA